MISSHVAHDCNIGNNVIIANNVPLGGHVTLRLCSNRWQFCCTTVYGNRETSNDRWHDRSFKRRYSFRTFNGNRNYLQGLNLIGLRRHNYDNHKIMGLNKAYKEIFASGNLHQNLTKINGDFKDNELVREVIKFIEKDKKRPICSPLS